MIDENAVAAELEATAIAHGLPELSQTTLFNTENGNSAMAIVIVTVSDPGIVEQDDAFTVPFGQPSTLKVLDNDVDQATGDNSTLVVGAVTQPPVGQGSVVISADRKTVIYTPPAGFVGQAQFSYSAARAT